MANEWRVTHDQHKSSNVAYSVLECGVGKLFNSQLYKRYHKNLYILATILVKTIISTVLLFMRQLEKTCQNSCLASLCRRHLLTNCPCYCLCWCWQRNCTWTISCSLMRKNWLCCKAFCCSASKIKSFFSMQQTHATSSKSSNLILPRSKFQPVHAFGFNSIYVEVIIPIKVHMHIYICKL